MVFNKTKAKLCDLYIAPFWFLKGEHRTVDLQRRVYAEADKENSFNSTWTNKKQWRVCVL